MTTQQLSIRPLRFAPILQTRIWGGTRLAETLGKQTATIAPPVGESWELSGLPGNESRVVDGPAANQSIIELATRHRAELLGDIVDDEHAFPLLIKFLDAEQPLSVQVHPKPQAAAAAGVAVKHEAWYIVDAEPGAEVYIGLNPGVTADDIRRTANTPAMRDLIQTRKAKAGDCFYLPSGTLHALGAGLLVAEVQTPSDTTYRIYDWDRVDANGKSRELHIAEALDNIRYDVADAEIAQTRTTLDATGHTRQRVCACERFSIDELSADAPFTWTRRQSTFAIWMILSGAATLSGDGFEVTARRGDTLLLPAAMANMKVATSAGFRTLEALPPVR
ncbi:MAG TPA: class I mannose-6-phosphate isomerase [Phycisphaerae bacterium]|nr:class I mannose-6-phosphate isomerase [Phycisphaerae bacterium]HRW52137.1 class I mannose-6-phosphate isomerase [Phycisphaerae bacterium]